MRQLQRGRPAVLGLVGVVMGFIAGCAAPPAAPPVELLAPWPQRPRPAPDAALEARIAQLLAGMSLEQKVGQMTQAEIRHVTPDEARRYRLGSVLNGGGAAPDGAKHANAADWVRKAGAFHTASMAAEGVQVPIVWGTDAVHGHNNVLGATLFPQAIGLGAAHEPALAGRVAAATARAVRATGIRWTFAPTVANARDARWGRAYESWSEDPALVRAYAQAQVAALQAGGVVATAKHFIGDGATHQGRDRGLSLASADELFAVHGQGYLGALDAGVMTVMASFNSWKPLAAGADPGKMHTSRLMLTTLLKERLGFDGFVVSDWDGIGQVPGCSDDSCPQAINAGIDMVMVTEQWKAFIRNTVRQVRDGQIPMARIDDAVSRILRVKLRAGLFDAVPAAEPEAGSDAALRAPELAREAVRKSLVLLKNRGGLLPLAVRPGGRVLVVGQAADSMAKQCGGWSLSWQGKDNANADLPAGDTILAGLVKALGAERVHYSSDARGVDVAAFDAVIAVVGEVPYAEGEGDIAPNDTLRHSGRYPAELALLDAVRGRGRPVLTVLLSGRPLFVNDLLNRSDAFVAAWLPGSEGSGVAEMLLRRADGTVAHEFQGRLPFAWPRSACQAPLFTGAPGGKPLFAAGYGLRAAQAGSADETLLDESFPAAGCEPLTKP